MSSITNDDLANKAEVFGTILECIDYELEHKNGPDRSALLSSMRKWLIDNVLTTGDGTCFDVELAWTLAVEIGRLSEILENENAVESHAEDHDSEDSAEEDALLYVSGLYQEDFKSENNEQKDVQFSDSKTEVEAERMQEESETTHDPTAVFQFECSICYEECTWTDVHFMTNCFHMYCNDCTSAYFSMKIKEHDVDPLLCMENGCSMPVYEGDVKHSTTPEEFAKFQKISLRKMLEKDKTAIFCPRLDCENVVFGYQGNCHVVCPECNDSFCKDCNVPWHTGLRCHEYQRQFEVIDDNLGKWMRKHQVKQCPRCGMAAQRIAGCPDMKCTGCNTHWDWNSTGENYNKNETKIERLALYYPRAMKEIIGSRDTLEEWQNNKKQCARDLVLPIVFFSSFGIPLTAVTAVPAVITRGSRKAIKRIRRLRERSVQ